jgi:hypothetical protein
MPFWHNLCPKLGQVGKKIPKIFLILSSIAAAAVNVSRLKLDAAVPAV